MAAEEHSKAEAHLIGSLIDSLSNAGEDEVFFSGSTPNSSLPLADSSSEKLPYDPTTNMQPVMPSSALPPHLLPYQILRQLQQQGPPQPPFWAPPPNSTVHFRGNAHPPYPVHLPPHAVNLGQEHGRWVPSPQNPYAQAPPPFPPPVDLQQQYQAYLAYQQQMHDLAAVRMPPAQLQFAAGLQQRNDANGNCNLQRRGQYDPLTCQSVSASSQGNEQWESIYTPFGPVRSAGANFSDATPSAPDSRLISRNLSLVDDSATLIGGHSASGENRETASSISADHELVKKRSTSASASHARNTSASNETSQLSSTSSSSMYPSSATTASSPSLPPKGRSYRDVAKTKTETKSGNSRASKKTTSTSSGGGGSEIRDTSSKGNDGDQSATEIVPSRPPMSEKKAKTSSLTAASRKLSVPARESSSDSMSEFGGSENGLPSAPSPRSGEKFVVENFVAGLLDKRRRSGSNDAKLKAGDNSSKLTDCNVLKKNATTATPPSGDFQKIMRRKGSQTKLGAVQGRDPSPVVTGASRYAVLGKKSPLKSDPTRLNGIENANAASNGTRQEQRQQQQQIKLNNEQTSPRFASKSPTRKAAYINNDLTWPSKTKSTNRRNDDGDFVDSDDEDAEIEEAEKNAGNGRRHLEDEEERDLLAPNEINESEEDGGGGEEEAYEDDGEIRTSKRKSDAGDSGVKNRKKAIALNGSSNQKFGGLKKGKAKRGDSGELAKKRRQQRGVVMRWIHLVLTAIACYIRDAAFWLVNLVTDIGHQLWEITVYCTKSSCVKVSTSAQCAWYSLGERLRKLILCIHQKEWSFLLWWRSRRNRGGDGDRLGLEENISLPNTGEEALKRLLSCRGQDAYSILGLRPDCTDDEVKCYYRRQAILVHPDKNACYGSDEAFKILAAAFELIGTSERRRAYDLQNLHKTKAMQELQEMLEKLREKMEEIRSTMQCDCGGKHKRFPTDRELAYARFCRKCGEKHHAREGDIWAESHWCGFLWYYYACMDGVVYDITEWAGCQKNNLKHMKPDTHLVQYRLITGRNARQFHHQQHQYGASSSSPGCPQQQYGYSQQQSNSVSRNVSNTGAEELLNRYWEDRLASTSKNASGAAYLPSGPAASTSSATNFGSLGGMDFTTPTQSKFNPPACSSHGDSRPRKAGRRRKART